MALHFLSSKQKLLYFWQLNSCNACQINEISGLKPSLSLFAPESIFTGSAQSVNGLCQCDPQRPIRSYRFDADTVYAIDASEFTRTALKCPELLPGESIKFADVTLNWFLCLQFRKLQVMEYHHNQERCISHRTGSFYLQFSLWFFLHNFS